MNPLKLLLAFAAISLGAICCPVPAAAEKYIHISKTDLTLAVVDGDSTIAVYPICAGKNYGQKTRRGDHKTPEGTFSIISIEDASGWGKNSIDGQGKYTNAYGPWFFRLKCPMSRHIGIHGTRFDDSIGTRDSFGCIRLHNADLLVLYPHIFIGMKVIIDPDEPQPSLPLEEGDD